jgi:type III secretory pathway component EscT
MFTVIGAILGMFLSVLVYHIKIVGYMISNIGFLGKRKPPSLMGGSLSKTTEL